MNDGAAMRGVAPTDNVVEEMRREAKRVERMSLYNMRKLAEVCTSCGEPLGDDENGQCSDCANRAVLTTRIYRRTSRGRKNGRRWKKREHRRRKNAGLCTRCAEPREKWRVVVGRKVDAQTCPDCQRALIERNNAYRRRRRSGLVESKEARAERRARERAELRTELRQLRKMSYAPLDVVDPREQILRALFRNEWLTGAEIFDVIGVPDDQGGYDEREKYRSVLSRLVRVHGHVQRRKLKNENPEYAITTAGRAAIADRMCG